MTRTAILLGILNLLLLAGLAGCRENTPAVPPSPRADEQCPRAAIPEIVERIRPGVVTVVASRHDPQPRIRHKSGREERERARNGPDTRPLSGRKGLGAGVIIDERGLVVTNHHVVEGLETLRIQLDDGRRATARIVEAAPKTDLALLQITEEMEGLRVLEFGNSSDLRLGEPVLALGAPFGLSGSVSRGIVSGLGRTDFGLATYEDFIQTDAVVNPGSSGGPLVTLDGEIVGLNTAIMSRGSGHQGIGFVMPSNMVRRSLEAMRRNVSTRGWLGITAKRLNTNLAAVFDIDGIEHGVLVAGVFRASPAHRAGLRRGDVILRYDDQPVRRASALRHHIAFSAPGSHHELEVWTQAGRRRRADVTLGRFESTDSAADIETESLLDGLFVASVSQGLHRVFDVVESAEKGVAILGVKPGSLPDRAGIEAGDVIVELNHEPVESLDQFKSKLKREHRHVVLLVQQETNAKYVLAER